MKHKQQSQTYLIITPDTASHFKIQFTKEKTFVTCLEVYCYASLAGSKVQ